MIREKFWKSPWRRSRRPKTILERRIWEARVALLDCVYYYFET